MRVSEGNGPWHDATPEERARYPDTVMPTLPNGERAAGGIFGGSGDPIVYDRHGNHWVKRGMHWELTDP